MDASQPFPAFAKEIIHLHESEIQVATRSEKGIKRIFPFRNPLIHFGILTTDSMNAKYFLHDDQQIQGALLFQSGHCFIGNGDAHIGECLVQYPGRGFVEGANSNKDGDALCQGAVEIGKA